MSERLRRHLGRVVGGAALGEDEAAEAMDAIMDGEATPAQIGGLLAAMAVRGETEDEIVAKVEQHVSEDHPELVGKLSRDDIVAMSEEVDD